jgi:urease accessory protein
VSTAAEGLLDLRFAVAPDGRTRAVRREFRFPLRMTAPMYLDPASSGMAFVYVQNPTGGVFAGDRLRTRLVLDAGATVHVTTQAATKVYRMDEGRGVQATDVTLAPGSYLELVPDLLIPHAGSRLVQTLDVKIVPGAALFATEMVAPGRLARGEWFDYALLDLRTRVFDPDGVELLADTLFFEPGRRRPERRGLAGAYSFVGTALALAPAGDVAELARAIDDACGDGRDGVAAGGCVLPGDVGVAVRALAHSHRSLRDVLHAVWRVARERLGGAPPPARRK